MSHKNTALRAEAESFATQYSGLWSTPEASLAQHSSALAQQVAKHYRPGFTFFTNGKIARFESQEEAAQLIESELKAAIAAGLGAHMTSNSLRIETIGERSALCWITFTFHPAAESKLEAWSFTNLYGYRAESAGVAAGWEFVIRDEEANEMGKVTGNVFDP